MANVRQTARVRAIPDGLRLPMEQLVLNALADFSQRPPGTAKVRARF
jgi:hypothetical protein